MDTSSTLIEDHHPNYLTFMTLDFLTTTNIVILIRTYKGRKKFENVFIKMC